MARKERSRLLVPVGWIYIVWNTLMIVILLHLIWTDPHSLAMQGMMLDTSLLNKDIQMDHLQISNSLNVILLHLHIF